jgi:hypothetical protein
MTLTHEQELRKKEMSDQIAALQQELAGRIASLDKQRKEEAEKFAQEVAERNAQVEMERAENLRRYQAMEAERKAKKEAEIEAAQKRAQEELRLRKQLESDLAAADEAKRLQQEKLEWLQNEIARQEFIEEQHRKAMQSPIGAPSVEVDQIETNVENPVAPDNKGEAVQGTDGTTPDHPLMSDHLKTILRQATRTY